MKINYTNLTFTELVNKIGSSRFFNLPKMVAEAFRKIPTIPEPTYKVYTALLTQSGTDAPVATVLENTLGDIVWSYVDVGYYVGTLLGAFTENKTGFFIEPASNLNKNAFIQTNAKSQDSIELTIFNGTTVSNGDLFRTLIEIRVYS